MTKETNNPKMPRILVVDDEENIRFFLCRLLEANKSICQSAADAAEARKLLKNQSFQLMLCDVNMPGESGIDLTRYVLAE